MTRSTWRPETLAIHGGQQHEPITGAVNVPIFQTSTYAQPSPGEHTGFEYSRSQNPTRFALERGAAALEQGKHGFAFASGCAATTTIVQMLSAGDHIISSDDVYGGTYRLFDNVMRRRGHAFSFVDIRDPQAVAAALTPKTKLVWVETPTNPLLKLADIAAIATICRDAGVLLAVDNTFASPILQRPLSLGADIVVHSTTKYMGGHADVVGGIVVTNDDELATQIGFLQNACGAVPGPLDCFLTLRGMKTLPLRMERQCKNAMTLASWLEQHPRVERVRYPGLPSHPQHELASRQMAAGGGMITVELAADLAQTKAVLERFELFTLAESLGGVESLVEHPAIMTHASVPAEHRRAIGITDGLIRLSVGVEHVEDLQADLDHALTA